MLRSIVNYKYLLTLPQNENGLFAKWREHQPEDVVRLGKCLTRQLLGPYGSVIMGGLPYINPQVVQDVFKFQLPYTDPKVVRDVSKFKFNLES